MPRYQRFEELPAWQEAAHLVGAVLDLCEAPNPPVSASVRSHLERAALAVAGRIATGFEVHGSEPLLRRLDEAREACVEIRSTVLSLEGRARTRPVQAELGRILELAVSCNRQLGAWMAAIGKGASRSGSDGRRVSDGHPGNGTSEAKAQAPRRSEEVRPPQAPSPTRPAPASPSATAARPTGSGGGGRGITGQERRAGA